MERLKSLERNSLAAAGAAVAVIFFLSLNILISETLKSTRLDLTEDRLFTLSDGTKEVLESIDEPIRLRFYLSKQLTEQSPVHANYANRVQEILEHYASIAGQMLQLEVYNPEPYSVEEDQAMADGLRGVPISNVGDMAYFGLAATNSTDDRQIVPLFDPSNEEFLEYDLTKIIYSLANPKKRVVGLYSSLPMGADPKLNYRPWPAIEQWQHFFTIRSLRGSGPEIPDDVDVLMIVHPQKLFEGQIYGIDQFVLRGGKVLVFVDPHLETAEKPRQGQPPAKGETSSNLETLFDAWGIEFSTDEVIADHSAPQRVNLPKGGRTIVIDYLPWLSLGADGHFDHDDVVTAQIRRINMASAGYFRTKPGATTKMTPLIVSSPQSMRVDVEKVNFIPDPSRLLDEFEAEGQQFVLAARVQGEVKSAFPDGPPWVFDEESETEGEGDEAVPGTEHLAGSVSPINVVVIGDVDMLADRFWLQVQNIMGRGVGVPIANNVDFVTNVLDNLSGSDALIGLRGRGLSYRPFDRIEEIRRDAELRFRKTEEGLTEKLRDTETRLRDLRQGDPTEGGAVLTPEQQEAMETFSQEVISIRQQLREVQHALRKDIEALDTWLKVANIWAMPLLVSLVALVLALVRRARYRQRTLHA
jgi:ABC-type uncharacterized transport system involved in gliding motility auxiliary subunit